MWSQKKKGNNIINMSYMELGNYCKMDLMAAKTDRRLYFPSLAFPPQPTANTSNNDAINIDQIVTMKNNMSVENFSSPSPSPSSFKPTHAPSMIPSFSDHGPNVSTIKKSQQHAIHRTSQLSATVEPTNLLPVLDCRFNMREICKQMILLEDHLTHPEKRCRDCCMKHFLAIEGLCEEAITLDKEMIHHDNILHLPSIVRSIARLWYEHPDENAHLCAQKLRQLRKNMQLTCFGVVFDDSVKSCSSCSSGSCPIST